METTAGALLSGELDFANASAVSAALADLATGRGDLHVDCSELGFVDVAACRALVLVARGLGAGRRLVLHDGSRNLRVVLETAGWAGVPEIVLEPTS